MEERSEARALRLAKVNWVDSRQPTASWVFLRDFTAEAPCCCKSVGWIVHRDETVIVLAASMADVDGEAAQISGVLHIPMCSVVAVAMLDEDGEEGGIVATLAARRPDLFAPRAAD